MDDYIDIRMRIAPDGPIGTPWQSDTLFGQLCWVVAQYEGPEAVNAFIEPFRNGDPPFVLSDGFPGDLLPVPLLSDMALESKPSGLDGYAAMKQRKKAEYMTVEQFRQTCRSGRIEEVFPDKPYISAETLHASLNRQTNSTDPGGALYSTVERYLPEGTGITVYARVRAGFREWLAELMQRLSDIGYGRDKSTGAGAFTFQGAEETDLFASPGDANGFVSLSSYVPDERNPVDGRWRIRVKRGFLGEMAGGGAPFKRPLVQFEPGAVFSTGGPPKPWYGRCVEGIAPGMPEAVQNCMALAVACRIPEEA